jgi:hypothetical protein
MWMPCNSQQLQSFQVLYRRCQQHLRVAAKVQGRRAQGAPVALHGFEDEAAPGSFEKGPVMGNTVCLEVYYIYICTYVYMYICMYICMMYVYLYDVCYICMYIPFILFT